MRSWAERPACCSVALGPSVGQCNAHLITFSAAEPREGGTGKRSVKPALETLGQTSPPHNILQLASSGRSRVTPAASPAMPTRLAACTCPRRWAAWCSCPRVRWGRGGGEGREGLRRVCDGLLKGGPSSYMSASARCCIQSIPGCLSCCCCYALLLYHVTAGDSHTCVLTALGAVWAWGTYRDASGVMGFGPHTRIQVRPLCARLPRPVLPHLALRLLAGSLRCWRGSRSWARSYLFEVLGPFLPVCRFHSASSLPTCNLQLTPVCLYEPKRAEDQVLRIASGAPAGRQRTALISSWAESLAYRGSCPAYDFCPIDCACHPLPTHPPLTHSWRRRRPHGGCDGGWRAADLGQRPAGPAGPRGRAAE